MRIMTDCLSCPFTSALEAENETKTKIIVLREHEIRQKNAQIELLQDHINWLQATVKINKTLGASDKVPIYSVIDKEPVTTY